MTVLQSSMLTRYIQIYYTHTLPPSPSLSQEWIGLKNSGYFKGKERREQSWCSDNMLHLRGLRDVAETVRDLSSRLARFGINVFRDLANVYVSIFTTSPSLPPSLPPSLVFCFSICLRGVLQGNGQDRCPGSESELVQTASQLSSECSAVACAEVLSVCLVYQVVLCGAFYPNYFRWGTQPQALLRAQPLHHSHGQLRILSSILSVYYVSKLPSILSIY